MINRISRTQSSYNSQSDKNINFGLNLKLYGKLKNDAKLDMLKTPFVDNFVSIANAIKEIEPIEKTIYLDIDCDSRHGHGYTPKVFYKLFYEQGNHFEMLNNLSGHSYDTFLSGRYPDAFLDSDSVKRAIGKLDRNTSTSNNNTSRLKDSGLI